MYQDRELNCKDCGSTFTFTAGEQEYYASKGLVNDPRRCANCRKAAKSGRQDESNRSSFRSGGSGGSYDNAPRQMTEALCSQCGNPTQVPFVPRGDRPVYCSECYAQMRGTSYSGSR